jgi:glycosyltransferase involved in cell wall biosynthesis
MFFKAIRQKAAIYQIHDPELIPTGILLRLFGKKVIYDIHENIAEDIFDKPWIHNKRLLYFFYNFFENIAVKMFHIILAETSYEPRYRAKGAKFTTILNYPDHEFFDKYYVAERKNNFRIFYIGILLESRGLPEIAEAMYILKQKGITVYFDIVGELYVALAEKLQALPFYSNIKDQLIFHGRLPLDQGYAISRNASVGMCIIQPMANSTNSYPTKMFEYMCIGLPQVISDFPLYRSVVEKHECGICVNPASTEEIAKAIEKLNIDKNTSIKFQENAQNGAMLYNWLNEEVKLFHLYIRL